MEESTGTPTLLEYTDQWLQPADREEFSNNSVQQKPIVLDQVLLSGNGHIWIEIQPVPAEPAKLRSIYGQLK